MVTSFNYDQGYGCNVFQVKPFCPCMRSTYKRPIPGADEIGSGKRLRWFDSEFETVSEEQTKQLIADHEAVCTRKRGRLKT